MYDTIQMNSTARTLPDIRMPTPRFTTMTGLGGGGHTAHDVNQQMNCFNQDREWQESRLASFAGQWTTRKYEAGVNTGLSNSHDNKTEAIKNFDTKGLYVVPSGLAAAGGPRELTTLASLSLSPPLSVSHYSLSGSAALPHLRRSQPRLLEC